MIISINAMSFKWWIAAHVYSPNLSILSMSFGTKTWVTPSISCSNILWAPLIFLNLNSTVMDYSYWSSFIILILYKSKNSFSFLMFSVSWISSIASSSAWKLLDIITSLGRGFYYSTHCYCASYSFPVYGQYDQQSKTLYGQNSWKIKIVLE